MNKLLFTILLLITATISFSQKEKAYNYVNKYKDAAIEEMKRSGVPAAITLAQGMLESGYGESDLCKKSNNHFGIKCKNEWTGAKVYHDDDEKQECFRAYGSAEESYKDHSDFLKSRPWYASLFKLDPTDFEGWAFGLKKAGYATEKDYPQKLISIINEYQLNQHSLAALKKENKPASSIDKQDVAILNVPEKIEPEIIEQDTIVEVEDTLGIKDETVIGIQHTLSLDTVSTFKSNYPSGIFTINHAKVIFANEGTSLLSIANTYNVSLSNLMEFNDLPDMEILDINRLIFIERKLKKGSKDFYIVQNNENLHQISQIEGIQLESLLQINKLQKNSTVKKGDKVYLRPTKIK